jgi:hypothetical protein
MPHPDEGLIHAWLDGELNPADAARVETLVANDAAWAAAAAEARGLIAASARIVGALDRAPANVIPTAAPMRPESRRWVWRTAAVLALMAGSAVVLKRESPMMPVPKTDVGTLPVTPVAPAPTPSPSEPRRQQQPLVAQDSKIAAAKKTNKQKDELADTKPAEPAAAKAAEPAAPVAAAPPAASAVAQSARDMSELQGKVTGANVVGASGARAAATERLMRPQPVCFEQREPPDSVPHLIRLNVAALADSIRLETLVLRGDTLAAVNGPLRAVRVSCLAP